MLIEGIRETHFPGLNILARGKVRDIYEADEDKLLIVATDRISAFDVVMPDPIPGKGIILTKLSAFWFKLTTGIIDNHLLSTDPKEYPSRFTPYFRQLDGRSMLVKKARPLPVECVVRGYLSGSGWNDYVEMGSISGVVLPRGLRESERLPEPIFTPASKAPPGQHDQPITYGEVEKILDSALAKRLRDTSVALYRFAAEAARNKGIIIADCKFEFGLFNDRLILIDELLTPDSSRFWLQDAYEPGRPQLSFDKQFLRDYLSDIAWDRNPPAPGLPADIIKKTRQRYEEALIRLTTP